MRSILDAIVAGTSPRFYIGHPIVGLTVAQLLAEAGGTGQTRTIVDPNYPGANGGVTWVASDPLTGTDPGGKARYWARYPDGSGGFWRRDDWNALTVGVGRANAIDLDWVNIDDAEDISAVVQELSDQYVDGAEGDTLSIKGLERSAINEVVIGSWLISLTNVSGKVYWYAPLTNAVIVRAPAWPVGSTNLNLSGAWTNVATNAWEATTVGTATQIRVKDQNWIANSNAKAASWPWEAALRAPEAVAADVTDEREWNATGTTVRIYSPTATNPADYYDDIQYLDSLTVDSIIDWHNLHTVYVEGGPDPRGGGLTTGLEFRGNAGTHPFAGWEPNAANESYDFTYGIDITVDNDLVEAGSDIQWYASCSEFFGRVRIGNRMSGSARYATGTLGGTMLSTFDPNTPGGGINQVHAYAGGSLGPAFDCVALWAANGWGGSISTNSQTSPDSNLASYRAGSRGSRNRTQVERMTGEWRGSGVFPFFSDADAQFGTSANDRMVWHHRGGNFTQGDRAFTPNGRDVYAGSTNSATPMQGKTDSVSHHQNSTAFFEHVMDGIVDHLGNTSNVDIRDDTGSSNDILNVSPDPETVNLGTRNPYMIFEATNGFNTGSTGGDHLWRNAGTGVRRGQGSILCAELSANEPSRNYVGRATHRGNGTDDLCISFSEVTCRFNFIDLVFGATVSELDRAIRIGSGDQDYLKSYDTTITDCTLKGARYIGVGRNTRPGPHNTVINGLTTEGAARNVVEIDHYTAGDFSKGHPVTVTLDADTDIATGHKIDVASGLNDDDVWPRIGGTYYELPWEKGGSNTTKSGSPNDLVSLNHTRRWISGAGSNNVFMPSDCPDNVQIIVGMAWDGDPGTVTRPDQAGSDPFSEIVSAADNLSDNSLYVKFYQGVFATGEDVWNWDGQSITKLFEWTNSRDNMSWVCAWRGQAASTPIGNSNSTPNNTAGTTPSAPTISTTANDSLVVYTCFNSGAANNTSFTGGPGGDIMRICRKSGSNYGDTGAGIGVTAAQVYAGTSGSKTGIGFSLASSQKSITTAIEIKT